MFKSNLAITVFKNSTKTATSKEKTLDPIEEIVSERKKARERGDLNANVCFLATVSEDGGGTVRALSLRDVDQRGFGILINGLSVKWAELESGRGFERSVLAYRVPAVPSGRLALEGEAAL